MNDYNIYQLIKPYLGKTIEKRDRKTSLLLFSIFENLPFFKMIKRNHHNQWKIILTNVISHLVFKEFEPEQLIFSYGEEIPGMYIIMDGKVNIYHIKNDNDKKLNNYNKNINTDITYNNKENENNIDINEKFSFSYQLLRGNSIGDECLKYEKKRIYFACTAASKCVLGYLTKENYEKIFTKPNNVERSILTGYLIGLRYFNEYCFTRKIQNYIYKKFYEKDSYIFIQNSSFKTFYIIYKGTINISLKLKKVVKCLIDGELLLGNNNTEIERFTSSRIHELNGDYTENNNYNLVNYEEGEIIGGIEFMKNIKKYMFTAKCLTEVELIEFNIKDFHYLNKIKQSQNFKNKINEQLNFYENRIKSINKNITNSSIFSKHNKFLKTFLKNHKNKDEKKYKYLYNIFDNTVKIYKPKKFYNTNIRPLSADFKKAIRYRKKDKDRDSKINKDNKEEKHRRNSLIVKYNKIKNKSKRAKSPDFHIYNIRNKNFFHLRKNCTEINQKQVLKKSNIILDIEKIKKNLSNNDNNSITTNIGTKSSYNFTDRYNSEGFNSLSSNLYFTSPKIKEKKHNYMNKIDKIEKLDLHKDNKDYGKKPKLKYTTINLFKENKKNIKINTKYTGVKKLFIIRDKYNENNTVSNILRNMFFTPQYRKSKNIY